MIAIISDIHSNLEALTRVIDYLEDNNISEIYCLGDIVGYGANPNECIELVRQKCKVTIIGNHDYAAIGSGNLDNFNENARISAIWSRQVISPENNEFLKNLDFEFTSEKFILVHSTPSLPEAWHYIFSEQQAIKELSYFDQQVCFVGHSHFPGIYNYTGSLKNQKIKMEPKQKYIVNVGSIGQPRDRDNRSCFCLFDTNKNTIELKRLEYNFDKTSQKIIEAGLPLFLAERIKKGF